MLDFKSGASYISKKYNVSIADANMEMKSILEDINFFKEKRLNSIEDLENYLTTLENYK